MKRSLLALSAFVLMFTACKKSDSAGGVSPTKENLAGNYKYVSIKGKVGNNPESDVTDSFLDACQKDDVTNLNVNLNYTVTDAGVQCNPPSNDSGTWSVSGNTFTLDATESFTISSFNGTDLVLTQTETVSGQTFTLTYNLKKQ
jgi:hypothetical protein